MKIFGVRNDEVRKKELCYIIIVAVMGVSLLLGFAVEVFGVDLGPAAWVAGWVSSPVALAIGFVFAMLFGKAFPDFNKTMSKKLLQYSVLTSSLKNVHFVIG